MSNEWADWLSRNGTRQFHLARKAGWNAFVQAAGREPLRRLDRGALARLSPVERADYDEARTVWNANLPTIRTSQLVRSYSIMDQVVASSRRDGDRLRGSVVIDSPAGVGKTTIATRYARDFHRRIYEREGALTDEGHQRLPVAFIPLSAGVTLKGLNTKILEFYGHPGAQRASTTALGSLAVDCVLSCQTRMIVIDELHFIDFKHRNGMEVSNHLKWLANEMPVTFVYVGMELEAKRFFDEGLLPDQSTYAQTSRRATRCPVSPFDISSDSHYQAWNYLLRAFEEHIVLADARPGMLTELANELFRRTQGFLVSLTNIIDRACWIAIATGTERIDETVLAAVTVDNAGERAASRR
ncbi:TniB family NTP-binding protein [Cellulomonas sp. PhB150]|uniref:TniB family NTP-binding protein n=1 Tax=Cellulomonas sp. PhB150 TaxID=2485188 RepID=UPI000F46012F|nr:TniB family NTP-binding protein [Cellulomonas sp. PhB150]ROS23717.1 TniB protein [Cellulomonas sp. PhB150]